MAGSVIQTAEDECFVCRTTRGLHTHHIFYGVANRRISDRMGYTVKLCYEHHEGATGVHANPNRDLDLMLKQTAQKHYEANHGSREDFIKTFGKSWL